MMDESRLAAYVDGALEPEEAAAVVMHLADNPADREHVARITELNALLAAAYSAPLKQPVPERILRTVSPSAVIPFPSMARRRPRLVAGASFAAAACVSLAVWAAIGPRAGGTGVGPVAPGSDLHAALEASPSGTVLRLPDGDEMTLIATFRDGRDLPCREFDLRHEADAEFSRGIACRGADAAWSVAVLVSEPVGTGFDDASYMPAAGATDAALRGALDVLGAGPSLSPDAEQAVITSGWSSR